MKTHDRDEPLQLEALPPTVLQRCFEYDHTLAVRRVQLWVDEATAVLVIDPNTGRGILIPKRDSEDLAREIEMAAIQLHADVGAEV